MNAVSAPQVVALDEQSVRSILTEQWAELARSVLLAEGFDSNAELNLTFVDATEMADLNAEHMGKDGPTDVLSFPLDDSDDLLL